MSDPGTLLRLLDRQGSVLTLQAEGLTQSFRGMLLPKRSGEDGSTRRVDVIAQSLDTTGQPLALAYGVRIADSAGLWCYLRDVPTGQSGPVRIATGETAIPGRSFDFEIVKSLRSAGEFREFLAPAGGAPISIGRRLFTAEGFLDESQAPLAFQVQGVVMLVSLARDDDSSFLSGTLAALLDSVTTAGDPFELKGGDTIGYNGIGYPVLSPNPVSFDGRLICFFPLITIGGVGKWNAVPG